jgi:uncharacterized protein (TIGR02996 family)
VADEPDDLLQAVLARPEDDEPRRDYARWCARQESRQLRDRAEFIDLQLRLAKSTPDPLHPPTRDWALESFLLAEHRRDWTTLNADRVLSYRFRRGFVEHVTVAPEMLPAPADDEFAREPVRHIDIVPGKGGRQDSVIIESVLPWLDRIVSLSLDDCGITDDGLRLTFSSSTTLRWLSVRNNLITADGIESLCQRTLGGQLVALLLDGNPFDPRERHSADGDFVVHRWFTEEGLALLGRYNDLPWMYGASSRVLDWIPSRFEVDTLNQGLYETAG